MMTMMTMMMRNDVHANFRSKSLFLPELQRKEKLMTSFDT